jgi:aminoglycoside phosphotransferase family enzyme/predicted kinase
MTPAQVQALAASLQARVVETHISWVLLGPRDAWKLKKPVRLPFLDYGSLEARRRCCEEELRLDRRLAPGLVLGVVPITGEAAPRLGGDGPPIDHALHMRRFPDGALLAERLAAGTLDAATIDATAALLAGFHAAAPVAPAGSGWGSPDRRAAVALAACDGAAAALGQPLDALRATLQDQAAQLQPLWAQRLADGWVREGHGDLHLANLLAEDGTVAAFDGIEFDPALRWIDVLDDLAFALMDLAAQGRRDLAFRLLDGWLERVGGQAGLPALPFACAYRALVRAQVQALRGDHAGARRYLAAARGWLDLPPPVLAITHGLPGSGKSWRSQQWLQDQGAVRLRSDVERKRLAGLPALADSRAAGLDLYTAEMTARTYARLFALARPLLAAGLPVVLDAAFLRRAEREAARDLARQAGAGFALLACEAPMPELRRRLQARRGDASEADVAVLERLAAVAEPLGPDERATATG